MHPEHDFWLRPGRTVCYTINGGHVPALVVAISDPEHTPYTTNRLELELPDGTRLVRVGYDGEYHGTTRSPVGSWHTPDYIECGAAPKTLRDI